MGYSIQQILAPQTVVQAISQLELPGTALQKLMGWGLGGTNKSQQRGRNFAYDIFNHTRQVATARAPGQESSRTSPQPVGRLSATFPRAAETIELLDEDLLNRRAVGGSADELDDLGETYITRQEAYLAQRFANLIEFQTAAMLRGRYAFTSVGDELLHSFETGEVEIDFQVPDSNRGQLDLLGEGNLLDADWEDDETDIPGQLQAINSAMIERCGMGLSHVVLTGLAWQQVINNQRVQLLGGTGNVVFESLRREGPGEFSATLRALPWITFHVVDYGLEVYDGTTHAFTRLIEEDHAAFLPEVSPR